VVEAILSSLLDITITEEDTEVEEEVVVVAAEEEETGEESGTRLEVPTVETIGTEVIGVEVEEVVDGVETVMVVGGEVAVVVVEADLMELHCPLIIGGKKRDQVTGTMVEVGVMEEVVVVDEMIDEEEVEEELRQRTGLSLCQEMSAWKRNCLVRDMGLLV